ncbi:MAG: hypothetical protein COV44_08075 [Deltaproteobacteria bacterium CG11_big_fil_rev_8_21_14_0_20_45_16]|nr:MAG: hypothetical protein COV44_08075 [Deltaproteobacteria bacterium CG11_big_fil_rev_8_21_14_0_20_45_16]
MTSHKFSQLGLFLAAVSVLGFSGCRPAKLEPPLIMSLRIDADQTRLEAPEGSALHQLGVSELWKKTTGKRADGERVRIAVIGTGVDYTIPDVRESLWINVGEVGKAQRQNKLDDDENAYADDVIGYDFYSVDGLPYDWHGHDTYTAGIIAATGRSNPAMQGVAPNAELMILRYLGSDGKTFDATWGPVDASDSIRYAVDNKARVIYFNWPQGGFHADGIGYVVSAFKYAAEKNVLIVTGAGNRMNSQPTQFVRQISALDNVLVVAGLDANGKISALSHSGRDIATVAAPQELSNGYFMGHIETNAVQSTSVAAAYVTGVAGLIASLPGMGDAKKIRAALLTSVDQMAVEPIDVLAGAPLSVAKFSSN